jgi:hypothetical protein
MGHPTGLIGASCLPDRRAHTDPHRMELRATRAHLRPSLRNTLTPDQAIPRSALAAIQPGGSPRLSRARTCNRGSVGMSKTPGGFFASRGKRDATAPFACASGSGTRTPSGLLRRTSCESVRQSPDVSTPFAVEQPRCRRRIASACGQPEPLVRVTPAWPLCQAAGSAEPPKLRMRNVADAIVNPAEP